MLISFNISNYNSILINKDKFFFYKENEKIFILPYLCRHRSGPLNFSTIDENIITCAWHGKKTKCSTEEKRFSFPLVQQKDIVSMVLKPSDKYQLYRNKKIGFN